MTETRLYYAHMRALRFYERMATARGDSMRPPREYAPYITINRGLQYYFTFEQSTYGDSRLILISLLFFDSNGEILFAENVRTPWTEWWWRHQGSERQRSRLNVMFRNVAFRHGIELHEHDAFRQLEGDVYALRVKYKAVDLHT